MVRNHVFTTMRLLAVGVLLVMLSAMAAAEPVTIRFNYRGGGARTDVVRAWITEFERQNPDIRIEWEQPASGWQDKLIVSMAAGTAPDVTEFWGNFAQQLGRGGYLLDLRPYVDRDMTDDDIADFFPALWQSTFVQFGPNAGSQFAQPRYINTMVTYFNTTMFEQAGLETPLALDRRGEWTWDTLEETARKLTRRVDGATTQWGFQTMTRGWDRMVQWMWEAGGDWFDPNDPTQFIGDKPEAVAAVEFLHKMIWQDGIANNDLDWNLFFTGRVGMSDDGLSVVFSRYDATIGDSFDWDLAPRAQGPEGRKPWAVDDGLGIWAGSQHPEEAWRFLRFITSKEGQEIMIRYEGLAPVRRSATPAFLELDDRRNMAVFLDTMIDAQMGITNRVAGDTAIIGSRLGALLGDTLVRGQKPFATAVIETKAIIEAIVKETQ